MSLKSLIEWTHATINFWWGCTEVSPACAHCYAREWAKFASNQLFGWVVEWGDGKPRAQRLEAARQEALKLNRHAQKSGQRIRVFANSMSDWLDDQVPIEWLVFLLRVIQETPWLDWQLLTKRPQNWDGRIHGALALVEGISGDWPSRAPETKAGEWINEWTAGQAPANVWIGTTVEDQTRADERIPVLVGIPGQVRFLSCEPLLGAVDLPKAIKRGLFYKKDGTNNAWSLPGTPLINWVICGGESGAKARPMHPDWARSLRDQCAAAGVAFFFKQWGEWVPTCAQYPSTAAEFHEAEDCGNCGDIALESNGVIAEGYQPTTKRCWLMERMGKKAAGRLLDGVEHNAFPLCASATSAFKK